MKLCDGTGFKNIVSPNLNIFFHPVSAVVQDIAPGAGSLGFNSRAGQNDAASPKTRHRCDVSSELCCVGAMPR